jgi:dipeptidyl aminopeptidase/acylaminoacyl peptidase
MPRLILFCLVFSFYLPAQTKHPFTFEDMMALKRVEEPVVSPDGRWIVFSVVHVNLEANTRTRHIWLAAVQGGEARQITSDPAGEMRPRWSPDGKRLLYVSAKEGGSQVWITDFDSASGTISAARKLTSISSGADGALWSPDGKNILFVSSVYPDCSDDACNQQRDDATSKSKVKAKVFTHLLFRHWTGYTEFKRSHLFVIPADGGVARDLTPGDHDVPPFNLGGQDLYTFSTDSKEIAFTSNIDEVEATSTNNEIFVVPVSGGTPKKISTSPGADGTPLYSPDGKYIAWRMQLRPGYESDRFRLVLYERSSGKITNLTENFDRWVESFVWSPDSQSIYFSAEDKGESPIYRMPIAGGTPVEVVRGHNDDVAITPDGATLFFTRMSAKAPNEIYAFDLAGNAKTARPVTKINDAVLSQIQMSDLEPFWFTGAERAQVQGFVVKPPNFSPAQKYPVKFLIHGGPQGAWGDSWTYRWNAQLFAANGYVVVMINPRGSTGYGQKFIDDINRDWGGRAYADLMTGLDYVERTYSYVDKNRECALGASYGGYMVNWIMGHTNRFKCLVSHDGIFNTESAFGTTEELWFPTWEFGGTPWTARAAYRRWSPSEFAANFKTPTLVVHSQLDYRLDVSEGFQLFTTLQMLKVPSKMLYFPDEGHWIMKPQNSQLWYKTVNEWVDSYVGK